MKKIDQVAFIVQARLGSQRVPQKMIRPFADTTLLDIMLDKLTNKSPIIPNKNVFLSVHEKELKDIGNKYDLNIFHRSEASANSEGTPVTEMYEWWDKLPHEYCVFINACCPFLTVDSIERFTSDYLKSDANGMFGVVNKKNYYWDETGAMVTPWPDGQDVMNTKVVGVTKEAAHCLYAGKLSDIGKGIWMGRFDVPGDIELYSMDNEFEILDVDYEWQFKMCEALYGSGYR
tara:strand:+ start:520 stop:1215 length:696 start_codon:yes stop_codon:yes gene_type:complete